MQGIHCYRQGLKALFSGILRKPSAIYIWLFIYCFTAQTEGDTAYDYEDAYSESYVDTGN